MKKPLVLQPLFLQKATTEDGVVIEAVGRFTIPTPCTFSITFKNLSAKETRVEVHIGSASTEVELEVGTDLLPFETKTLIVPQGIGTLVTVLSSEVISIIDTQQHLASPLNYGAGGLAYTISAGARDNRDSSISLAAGSSLVLHKLQDFGDARLSLLTPIPIKAQLDGADYRVKGIVTFNLSSSDFNSLFFVAETGCTIRFSLATTPPANSRQHGGTSFSWEI